MKSNIERILECLTCKYWKVCEQTVAVPEDYPDGSCKTKDSFKDKTETGIWRRDAMAMDFDNIFDRLKNRIWMPMSDMDAVDMIINSYVDGNIDDEEKELLLDLV